jgi:signal transduction histidine kinase
MYCCPKFQAEQRKRETIEAAMKLKDEFLYLITHEFKTPITVISSVLQTVESFLTSEIPEKFRRYLNMIKVNTNRQLRLVNNLLDITRLNSGTIKVNKSSVDIVYISKAIVKSVEIYAKQKQTLASPGKLKVQV